MKKLLAVLTLSLSAHYGFSQDSYKPEDYIRMYADMAVQEMHHSGVPASITLAQGILESGCGNSELAKKAKNHFGIKGHRDWKGKCYYMDDDEKDECFRVYKSVAESYRDHSEFLHSNTRYDFLFELRTTDYKGWARGLKKAGYATNPKYAELLINLIERYELYEYDRKKERRLLVQKRIQRPRVFEINGIPAIAYDGNMTIRELRDKYFIAEWQIFKYNDFNRSVPLKKDMIIYLKPKKRRNKVYTTHTVKEGETMQFISQLRGIKLNRLYKLNLIDEGEEPIPGAILSLKDKRAFKPKTKNVPNPDFRYFTLEDDDRLLKYKPGDQITEDGNIAERREVEKDDGLYHQVGSGETLISIARAYGMDWEVLREQNGLASNDLKVGQLLLIEARASSAIAEDSGAPILEDSTEVADEPAPDSGPDNHLVKEGETLFSISRLYGLTVAELMRYNNLHNPSVSKGQELQLTPGAN